VLQGKSPITHLIGGWVGHRASLDILENRQFSCTCQETNHDCLVPTSSLVTIPPVLSGLEKGCVMFDKEAGFLLLLSSGPRAYAPDAPQPIDLLCNPSIVQTFPPLPPVRLLVRVTQETPGSERWNYYVGEKHGQQFCLNARLPRNI